MTPMRRSWCATAGAQVVGKTVRLWGAGTLPEYRRRGTYSALLTERCRLAHALGATLGPVALPAAHQGDDHPEHQPGREPHLHVAAHIALGGRGHPAIELGSIREGTVGRRS